MNGLLRHFVVLDFDNSQKRGFARLDVLGGLHHTAHSSKSAPRNDGNSGNPQSLIKVKGLARASRGRGLTAEMTQSLQTSTADPLNASEQDFAYLPIHLFTSKRVAFTLAEVLVTLAVIGIVAAMTIPNLVQNYNEKVTVTKVKKMYSVLSNAYELVKVDNGDYSQWGGTSEDKDSALAIRENFEKYLKFTKLCDDSEDLKECGVADIMYLKDNKEIDISSPSQQNDISGVGMLLADGSSLYYVNSSRAVLFYDVNGLKEPNTFGRDIFTFEVWGNESLTPGCGSSNWERWVKKFGFEHFEPSFYEKACKNRNTDGTGFCCASWIIREDNMDYLN